MTAPPAIDRERFRLPAEQYFQQAFPKDLIVLHFTAGTTARSAFDSWVQSPVQVATPYIVDTDGAVYDLFDPRHWAYHLGIRGPASGNWKHDKRSIGIEIVNPGPLKVDAANPQRLNWWPNDFKTRWCDLPNRDRYVAADHRGFAHFASFPAKQAQAVALLCRYLTQIFGIPRRIPPPNRRAEFDLVFYNTYQGIASHQNFRDDKTDIGPAWDWTALQTAGFS